jgi:hypothetical protein
MTNQSNGQSDKIARLERHVRRLHAMLVITIALPTTAFVVRWQTPSVVRTRQLVIEDQEGRARIVIGAPVRDNFDRVSPTSGMVIRDSLGHERFGVGLDTHGNMGLGLDAPRCTSDPCNTERINLVADADGGSHLRFLDRNTGAAALLYLADDDRAYLEFLRVTKDSVRRRRLGLSADTLLVQSRR